MLSHLRPAAAVLSACGLLACLSASAGAQPLAPAGAPVERFDGHAVVRVQISTPEDLELMLQISPDPWSCRLGLGPMDFRIPPDRWAALRATGLPHQVIIPDVQSLVDAENERLAGQLGGVGVLNEGPAPIAWFSDFKTLDQISAFADSLVTTYPTRIARITIGSSVQQRPIWLLRIADPATPADAPAIFINGGLHAREWVSPMTAMFIANQLATGDGSIRIAQALQRFQFFILPVANPDGYVFSWTNNRMWRKNRRQTGTTSFGIDLNRNWSYGFGRNSGSSGNLGSDVYRGPSAFSEPETQALRDFVTARPFIRSHFDLHSYSQLLLQPWAYQNAAHPSPALFADFSAAMLAAINASNGATYTAGPTGSILYLASGTSSDWSTGARDAIGYGVELRDTGQFGFILPASQIAPTGQEMFAALLAFSERLAGLPRVQVTNRALPPQPPIPPATTDPAPPFTDASQPFTLALKVTALPGGIVPGSVRVVYRMSSCTPGGNADGWYEQAIPVDVQPATALDTLVQVTLPTPPCGRTLQYGVLATGADGRTIASPLTWPERPFRVTGGRAIGSAEPVACTGGPCPADIAGIGGAALPDGVATGDDFVAFINGFVASECQADIAGIGGVLGADGQVTGDDFIAFINAFAAVCN